jgi:ubiquinone/menaquinone biosynthesis C-methylase UbiE
MTIIGKLKQYLKGKSKEINPEKGYDIWAVSYDDQPDNLMLALDEAVFTGLAAELELAGKKIVDVGCGTGRHWKKIFDAHPAQLTGYDVSEGMLNILQQKFPAAETYQLTDNKLFKTEDNSCDIIISTLTMAHIENAKDALQEWNRVLKPGGSVIITDYHPEVLQKGGQRTFKHNGKTVAVKNHIYPVEELKAIAGQLGWQLLRLNERRIDDSVKYYYEKQNALHVFDSFKGMPVIYGLLFKKINAT